MSEAPASYACRLARERITRVLAASIIAVLLSITALTVQAQRPLGTDVSGYQPSINWTTVDNAGVAFAWAKATEGTGYVNPYFTSQESGAKSVGIYIGAYHFARPSSHPNITGLNSADSEAAYFWSVASNYVNAGGSYMVPMLDWEDTGATLAAGFTSTTMSAWVNEWCNAVSNYARLNGVAGVRPVVYTGTWYSRPGSTYPGLTTAVNSWPSWIAAYPTNPNPQTGAPSDTYPWSTWNIWQYADTNWSGGDADVFNGTLASFIQMFVMGGTNYPAITANPTNQTVAAGVNVTFSARASGQAPLSFQWRFNGNIIPGATSSNYTLLNAQVSAAGAYSVTVTNALGFASSTLAFLGVVPILINPAGAILAPAGLVDWWPAEGNPNDLFSTNNAKPFNGFTYVAGKEGLAFHLDGSSSYLVTAAASVPVPWTACLWVNRQNAPGTGAALLGDGTYELKLEQYNGTRQVGLTQFGVGDYTFGCVVPTGVWTHLAFVGTSSGTTLYVNGLMQSTLTNSIPLPRGYIGAGYVASGSRVVDYMLGGLDELLLFNRALSSGQIAAIYNAGSAGLVRTPEFTGVTPLNGTQFGMTLRGITGKTFTIYRSPDFLIWTKLTTVANPSGSIPYTDANAVNSQYFYRATQP